jgi:hypothetical protein
VLPALVFLALATVTAPPRAPVDVPVDVQGAAPAAAEERCPYRFDRNRKMWLHASQFPRYVYYRTLEPGDGTRRSSMMARLVHEAERIHEATFEVVTRIEEGTTTYRVLLTRTIDGAAAGLDLAEPARIVLTAARGKDEEPLRIPSAGGERTERAGWTYESTTFEPSLSDLVALVDTPELEVTGPGGAWKPVLDDTDRAALRFFLWHHAPGGRAALELSEQRRAGTARGWTGKRGDEADGGTERDG